MQQIKDYFSNQVLNPEYSYLTPTLRKTKIYVANDRWFASRGIGTIIAPVTALIDMVRELCFGVQACIRERQITSSVKNHLWKSGACGVGAVTAPVFGFLSPSELLLPGMVKLGIKVDGVAAEAFSKWKALAAAVLVAVPLSYYAWTLQPAAHQAIATQTFWMAMERLRPTLVVATPLLGISICALAVIRGLDTYLDSLPKPKPEFDREALSRAYAKNDEGAKKTQVELLKAKCNDIDKHVLKIVISQWDADTLKQLLQALATSPENSGLLGLERRREFIHHAIHMLQITLTDVNAKNIEQIKTVVFDALVAEFNDYSNSDPNATFWQRPLSAAVEKGYNEVVSLFIEMGAHVDTEDTNGATPLMLAAYFGHQELYNFLIAKGADIHRVRSGNDKDNFCAIGPNNQRNARSVLRHALTWDEFCIAPNRRDAWKANKSYIINDLIARGVDLDGIEQDWAQVGAPVTHLIYATTHEDYPTVRALTQAGADWSIGDIQGKTAHSYWRGPPAFSPFQRKVVESLGTQWSKWRKLKGVWQHACQKDPFASTINVKALPGPKMSLPVSNEKFGRINAAAMIGASTTLRSIDTSEQFLIDEDTFTSIETYLSTGTITFEGGLEATRKMRNALRACVQYGLKHATAQVEALLITKLKDESSIVVGQIMEEAQALGCADLLLECQKQLRSPLKAPPGRSNKTYSRGFHALWDAAQKQPLALAADQDRIVTQDGHTLPVHSVVLANAQVQLHELQTQAKAESTENIQRFLELLYTGKLPVGINIQDLYKLAWLGRQLSVTGPFKARLTFAYLDSVMKNALIRGQEITAQQIWKLGQLHSFSPPRDEADGDAANPEQFPALALPLPPPRFLALGAPADSDKQD